MRALSSASAAPELENVAAIGRSLDAAPAISAGTPATAPARSLVQKQLARIIESNEPVDVGWVDDFYLGLYGGVEGATVDDATSRTNGRFGMIAYSQFASLGIEKVDKDLQADTPGMHAYFTAFATSAATAEEKAATADNSRIERVFEGEVGLYFPFLLHLDGTGALQFGPLLHAGLVRPEETSDFRHRRYAGVRFAHSPESYLDLTYGKTEQVVGRRMEVRGQIPVARLDEGGRIFVGFAANFDVEHSSKDSPDDLRFFVTWNGNFSDLLQGDSGN